MAETSGEGKVYISMEELLSYLYSNSILKSYSGKGYDTVIGVPTFNKETHEIEISYAYDSVSSPADWTETPHALKEWEK